MTQVKRFRSAPAGCLLFVGLLVPSGCQVAFWSVREPYDRVIGAARNRMVRVDFATVAAGPHVESFDSEAWLEALRRRRELTIEPGARLLVRARIEVSHFFGSNVPSCLTLTLLPALDADWVQVRLDLVDRKQGRTVRTYRYLLEVKEYTGLGMLLAQPFLFLNPARASARGRASGRRKVRHAEVMAGRFARDLSRDERLADLEPLLASGESLPIAPLVLLPIEGPRAQEVAQNFRDRLHERGIPVLAAAGDTRTPPRADFDASGNLVNATEIVGATGATAILSISIRRGRSYPPLDVTVQLLSGVTGAPLRSDLYRISEKESQIPEYRLRRELARAVETIALARKLEGP